MSLELVKDAAKITLAFGLCLVVPHLLGWQQPAYALFSVIMLATPYLGFSLDRALLRIVGVVVAVGASLALITFFATHWALFVLLMCLWVGGTCYLAAGRFYPYSFVVACFFTVIIAGLTLTEPEQTWWLAQIVAKETILGTVITIGVYSFLWPRRARRALAEIYRDAMHEAHDMLEASLEANAILQPDFLRERQHRALAGIGSAREVLYYAGRESADVRRHYAQYQQLGTAIRDVVISTASLVRAKEQQKNTPLPVALARPWEDYVRALRVALQDFEVTRAPQDGNAFRTAGQELQKAWGNYLGERGTFALPLSQAADLGGLMDACAQLDGALRRACEIQREIHLQKHSTADPGVGAGASRREYLKQGGISDFYQLRKSLQAVSCCGIGFLVYLLVNPAGGTAFWVNTVIGGAINALMPNMRLSHAMFGCLLGFGFSALLLFGIYPCLPDSLPLIILCTLPFVFINACFYCQRDKVVIGLLGNLMLALTIFINPDPIKSGESFVTTLDANVYAFALAGLVVALVWPIFPKFEFRACVRRLLQDYVLVLEFWEKNSRRPAKIEAALSETDEQLTEWLTKLNLWMRTSSWHRRQDFSEAKARAIVGALEDFTLRLSAIERSRQHLGDVAFCGCARLVAQ